MALVADVVMDGAVCHVSLLSLLCLVVVASVVQLSLVLRECTRWGLTPTDGPPVVCTPEGAAPTDTLVHVVIPPSTLVVQVARLSIDRGVFELRVFARGPAGPTTCLGALPART